jgi:hypothetical protein
MTTEKETRMNEWFVPRFGPTRFRVFVGLLFLPYTGMCISFAVIGSLLPATFSWERVVAIAVIYALALGISAHAADTVGSKKTKPWGNYFSKRQLLTLAGVSLAVAYLIGLYYIVFFTPMLALVAVLEGFFLLAYNFELFGGRFHNDFWFCVSWGALPLMAGYVIQTNAYDVLSVSASVGAGLVSYVQIRLSRPYKEMRRSGRAGKAAKNLENGLKTVSLGTISFASVFTVMKIIFS